MERTDITTSQFINSILNSDGQNDKWEEYKALVTTEFDKWFWNRFKPCYISFKFETTFNPAEYSTSVFKKYVPFSGKSNTYYGEFIRAFNKLIYRYLNDGDSIFYGPYSALFFKYLGECKGDRKFKLDDCGSPEIDSYEASEFSENVIQNFNDCMCRCVGLDAPSNNLEECANCIICIIDHLHDDLKGLKEYNENGCDSYYKNVTEFENPDLYQFLTDRLGLHNVMFDNDRIDEEREIISFDLRDYNQLIARIDVRIGRNNYHMDFKPFDYKTVCEDDSFIEHLSAFIRCCHNIDHRYRNRKDKADPHPAFKMPFDILIDILNHLSNSNHISLRVYEDDANIYTGELSQINLPVDDYKFTYITSDNDQYLINVEKKDKTS